MPNIEVNLLQTYNDSTPPLTNPPTPISYKLRTGYYPINKIVDKPTTDVENPLEINRDKEIDTIQTTKNTYYLIPESDANSFSIISDIPNFQVFNENLKLTIKNLFDSTQGEFIYKINNSLVLNEELDLPRIPSKGAHNFNIADHNKILKPIDLFKCGIVIDGSRNFQNVRWAAVTNDDKVTYGLDTNEEYAYTEMFILYTYEAQITITGQTRAYNREEEIDSKECGEFKHFDKISQTIKLPYALIVPTPTPPILKPKNKDNKDYPLLDPNMKPFYRDIYYYLRELEFDTNNDNHKLVPIVPDDVIDPETKQKMNHTKYHNNLWKDFTSDIKLLLSRRQIIIDSFNKYGVGSKQDSDNFNLEENCNKNCWKYLIHKITNFGFSSRHYISGIDLTQVGKPPLPPGNTSADRGRRGFNAPCSMFFSLPPINTTEMTDKHGNQLRLLNDLRPLEPSSIPEAPKNLNQTLLNWTADGNGLIDPSIPRVYEFNNDDSSNEYSKHSMSELTKYLLFTNLDTVYLDQKFKEMRLVDKKGNNRYSEFYELLGTPGREYTILNNIQTQLEKQFVTYNQNGVWYRVKNNKFQQITPIIENTNVKK